MKIKEAYFARWGSWLSGKIYLQAHDAEEQAAKYPQLQMNLVIANRGGIPIGMSPRFAFKGAFRRDQIDRTSLE